MNKRAEVFQEYLNEKEIEAFVVEEIEGDEQETSVFRSHIVVEGQRLPTAIILDNSVFGMVRVQISPKARTEENELELSRYCNDENRKYKPFKLYFDEDDSLVLDACLVEQDEELAGDTIYLMLNVVISYLNDNYRDIMKKIW